MPVETGLDASFAIALEDAAYGTFTAPTRSIGFVSESLTKEIARIESKAIRRGEKVKTRWAPGQVTVSGDVEFEMESSGFGPIFAMAIGSFTQPVTGTGGAANQFVFVPGEELPTGTIQVGVPAIGGTTIVPKTVLGAAITELEIAVGDEGFVTLKSSVVGRDLVHNVALTNPAYRAAATSMTFVGASVTINGVATDVKDLSFKLGNFSSGTGRRFIGSDKTKRPLPVELRPIEIECKGEFTSLVLDALYEAGTLVPLVATYVSTGNPLHRVVISCQIRIDGETETVGGTEVVEQPVKATALGPNFSLTYHTPDAF